MLNSIFKTLMISILSLQTSIANENVPSTESITITGSIRQTGMFNKLPINLKVKEGHPYAYIYVNIYVNEVLVIQDEEITKYLPTKTYEIDGFTYDNEKKNIKIEVNYIENHVETSVCEMLFLGPSYGYHKSYYSDSLIATDNNPIETSFTFKGKDCVFDRIYEQVVIDSSYYKATDTRFLSFSDLTISLYSIYDELETCELRLFCKFEDSDILYKNNLYTSIDLELEEISNYKYRIKDDYRFYIDNHTGMIYETQTDSCADELYPLFIPLSLGKKISLDYEIHFSNLGLNNSDYIFSGSYYLYCLEQWDDTQYGSIMSYKYKEIFEELTEVEYA